MTALFDAQGIQSRSFRERGVARYITELAEAMERWFPETVASYLINPSLPVASALESLPDPARIGSVDEIPPEADVYHVGSPFEPDVQLDLLWPPAARSLRLVVTLYDLIPQLFPDIYLTDPATRTWYRTRLNLIRRADRVLAISSATAADAVDQLGVPADRVVVVGAAAADRFLPPPNREAALEALRALRPEIEPRFLLYTGGIEPRKNIDRLLVAYAGMSERLRRTHQLVIVCRILPDQLATLEARLRELGIAGRVHFTNYVNDDELTLLYGTTTLFVFPSLYEGFGLPIAEAMACGAPVVSSGTSSLPELVLREDARFDPWDIDSIRSALERFLGDPPLLDELRRSSSAVRPSWREVAACTATVYEELSGERRPRRARRKRPRVAYVSPLPPQRSGVADYSYRLLEALSGHCDTDAFVDTLLGDQQAPPGVRVAAISHFDVVERLRVGYDRIFVCLGNSEHHMAALALLRRRGGVVLAHDVRLTGLYGSIPHHRPEVDRRPMNQMLEEMYGAALPEEVLQAEALDPSLIHAHSIFMAREVIGAADRFVVHSQYAAHLARSDAAPHDRHKVGVAPFAFPSPGVEPPAEGDTGFVIGTFGVVAPVKQTEKVLEAFAVVAQARADAALRVAGPPAGPGDYDRLRIRAAELGVLDRVQLLGHVDGESFRRLVAGTTIAVQLRAISMGESPASVGDCLAAGVPTVVSAVGAARELPDKAVMKVQPDVRADALGQVLLALADDGPKRATLRAAGQALASERSFEHAARFIYERLVLSGASGAEIAA